MAPPDPSRAQVVNPELIAEVIRLLGLRGPLGELNVNDDVRLTFNLGSAGFEKSLVFDRAVRFSEVITNGIQVAAPAATIHADTGPLAVGTYDIEVVIQQDSQGAAINWEIQWRDAANAANLATIQILTQGSFAPFRIAPLIALANERFRIINVDVFPAAQRSYGEMDTVKRIAPGFVGSL